MKHQNSQLHQGRDSSYYSIINDNYYWIGIKNDIDNYIKNCVTYAKLKYIEKNKREKNNLFFLFLILNMSFYTGINKQTNKQRLIKKILITFIFKKF